MSSCCAGAAGAGAAAGGGAACSGGGCEADIRLEVRLDVRLATLRAGIMRVPSLVRSTGRLSLRLGAGEGTRLHAFLAPRSQTEEPADHGTELHRLVVRELAALQHGDLTLGVLEDDERVDHA